MDALNILLGIVEVGLVIAGYFHLRREFGPANANKIAIGALSVGLLIAGIVIFSV